MTHLQLSGKTDDLKKDDRLHSYYLYRNTPCHKKLPPRYFRTISPEWILAFNCLL